MKRNNKSNKLYNYFSWLTNLRETIFSIFFLITESLNLKKYLHHFFIKLIIIENINNETNFLSQIKKKVDNKNAHKIKIH